mmetsp:Transcript_30635/g.42659  ORF Transcript_30635/g.42659 Transcript_30635/m.42659 type:complete len:304 (+) Transcript_30635:144-1055(+)
MEILSALRKNFEIGKVSESADPCESNYAMTKYIAEPFNALSALGLILAGSNAMHQSRKYNFEVRFSVLGFSVVLIGTASALFHATLSPVTKAWEEMAIIWATFGWMCILAQISNTTNKTPSIAMFLALAVGVWVTQLGLEPRILILGSHILQTVACAVNLYLLNKCVEQYCNLNLLACSPKDFSFNINPHPSVLKLQLMARWHVGCATAAFIIRAGGVFFCETFINIQPHALWHLLLGVSCHYGLQFAMALRQSILHKAPPATSWTLGGLLGCVVPTEVPSRAMGAQLRWLLKMAGVDQLDSV